MTKDFGSRRYLPRKKNLKVRKLANNKRINLKELFALSLSFLNNLKRRVVSKMFWGRSSFYKNIVHLMMVTITVMIAISGIFSRIAVANNSNLKVGQEIIGSNDLLPQGGSIETVLISTNDIVDSIPHKVVSGETLSSISEKYNVSADTIRWFNPDLISPFTNEIQVGWELKIPAAAGQPINGILYTVKAGQTIEDVIKVTSVENSEANVFNIVQFNNLPEPYTLSAGQKLFIPDGNMKTSDIKVTGIPRGVFINPLSDGGCGGYSVSRGFLFYHNGVDLARWPTCPIVAVATGTVTYAGWSSGGEGYNVKIDHGGGISTHYYHGNGEFGVKVGDRVQQGQYIMMMGSTGNSTGVHLHFSLLKDGVFYNPYGYVPY